MLSKKIKKHLDNWFMQDTQETFMERIEYLFESEKKFEGEQDALRYAHTFAYILSNISVVIDTDMEIMGKVKIRKPEAEEKQEIMDTYKRWWDIPLEERHKKILFYYSDAWLRCRPYWFPSFGHLALDWETIINEGYGALKRRAQERLQRGCSENQKYFLQGAVICYDALIEFYKRYAKEAEAKGCDKAASNLKQVSEGPALTFEQGLQQLWLLVLVLQKVCGCGVLNYSRMDQYLRSLYEKGMEDGSLTQEHAGELLQEFFYRNNEIMVQTDHMSLDVESTKDTLEVAFDDPNYLTVGGMNADGTSAVCGLSKVIVKAAWDLKLRNPFLIVRYHKGMDEDFWRLCCEAIRDNTTLVLYNDETMIPALKYYGVEEPEVYDYGFWGCNDPNIPAYEGGLRQLWMNMLRPLELALNEGDYPMEPKQEHYQSECEFSLEDRMTGLMTGPYYGVRTKPVEEMETMEDFLEAYQTQLNYLMGEFRKGFEMDLKVEKSCTFGKMRIEDCFLKGTIENAVTWTEGGTKYHKIVAQGCGLATAVNALYAIEQIVFVKKEMTLSELAEILKDDYKGSENLALRWKNKLEKFGNDHDGVDRYAKILTDMFVQSIDQNNGPEYLYQMWPTYSTDRDFTTMGAHVGATPDGRRAKEPLSENQSPSEGSDLSGITAMLNSLSKVPFDHITGGPLNVKLHPSVVKGEEGLDALCALYKTYMEQGGMQLQTNVLDAETLKKAQEEPDKYRSLCVRVTGYSAFFVEMGRKAQDELIHRTEHLIS